MASRVRLNDIAELAGVSVATVSRVVNGSNSVRKSTADAVMVAIDTLGYDRPLALSDESQETVGVIIPELTNPIFASFSHYLQLELARHGLATFICSQTPGGSSEKRLLEALTQAGVKGVIFVCGRHADTQASLSQYHALIASRTPSVIINGPRQELAIPSITTNDSVGITHAINHLQSLGHTKIALVCGRDNAIPAKNKRIAFETAMRARFPGKTPIVFPAFYTFEGGQAAAQNVIDSKVTAVIAGSDLLALGVIYALRQNGIKVPQEISVIGMDDSPLITLTDPPLTTLRQPVQKMVTAAVEILREQMGNSTTPQKQLTFVPDLIVRGSTAALTE
ncbi:LacI family transcriptional regulator [Actinomycetaceae bacterium TAE3-ERU4]|nr:LacI family transcriptional regulator [Actinomycetaceae bacterium TAE3-ERU4]